MRGRVWLVALMALVIVSLETGLRLGADSPDTRFTLPRYSLGFFWDTPLGWTGVVDGVAVNKDSVQFASLAGFFRDELALAVPLQGNVYTRFAGYSLLGSIVAPIVGAYASFVFVNVLFWVAAALATYALALRHTGSVLVATLAALLVTTAPVFEALAGQALPYVTSYGLFVLSLLLFERVRLFERSTPSMVAMACGTVTGMCFLFYDLYMLPAFVVAYGPLRRMRAHNLVLVLVAMAIPRLVWTLYWGAAQLPSFAHNEQHPFEALLAWLDTSRMGTSFFDKLAAYAALAAHGVLNVGAVFLFWPVALALYELWSLVGRRSAEAVWFVAVLVAGFAPALFMLVTWPHIPRWYAYGFPAVYILAAAGAVRLSRGLSRIPPGITPRTPSIGIAVLLLSPALVLANLDLVGFTRPMELLLFQPTHWSYLWSR